MTLARAIADAIGLTAMSAFLLFVTAEKFDRTEWLFLVMFAPGVFGYYAIREWSRKR